MGRDRTQLLACALIAISLVLVGTLAIDWFSTEGGMMKISLLRARVCTGGRCTALPHAALGSYGSAAIATLILTIGVTALVGFQTAARLLLDHAIPKVSQVGSVLAVLAIGSVFVTAFVLGPDDDLAQAVGLSRSGAPMLAFAGLCVSIAALAMAIAPANDMAAPYQPVVIPKARIVVPRPESEPPEPVMSRTPARRIPMITQTPEQPLSVVSRPPARVVATTSPPLATATGPETARIPVMADAVDLARRLEQPPVGTGNVPALAPRAAGTTGQTPIVRSASGSVPVVDPRRPATGSVPVVDPRRPATGSVPVVARPATGANPIVGQHPATGANVVARPATGANPVVARPPTGANPIVARPPTAAHPVVVQRPVTGANRVVGRPPTGASPVVAPATARIPVLADAVDSARTQQPASAPTPARVKSGPLPVLPPHLRGQLRYIVIHAELTLGGIDARREDGSSLIVLWRDVVGIVVRRMPPVFDGITFVDVVSTAGATVRLVPWTRIRGAECEGDDDARARTLLELVSGRCPEARLDPATQRFNDGLAAAAQLPDVATLEAHDERLA